MHCVVIFHFGNEAKAFYWLKGEEVKFLFPLIFCTSGRPTFFKVFFFMINLFQTSVISL